MVATLTDPLIPRTVRGDERRRHKQDTDDCRFPYTRWCTCPNKA